MNPNSKPQTTRKKILFIVVSVVIFIGIGFATVISLKSIVGKTATGSQTATVMTPTDLMAAYIAPNTINSLSSKLYRSQPISAATIQYHSSSKTYSVGVSTTHSSLFSAINQDQPDDSALVQNQTIAFMTKEGFTKTNDAPAAANGLVYTNFANSKTVCQLTDSSPAANSGLLRYHQMSCVDKTVIDSEYTAIESLLAIYNQSHTISKIAQVNREVGTDKNVSYATLAISTDSAHLLLLFGAVDNSWSYLGNLTVDNAQASSSRYNITPEVRAKINDPKYNGFIAKNIH